jgi:2,4-diketo-3-deoxy-L-fuconate hydrolase
MRFYSFQWQGARRFGVALPSGHQLLDLTTHELPTDPREFIANYSQYQRRVHELVESSSSGEAVRALDSLQLLAPIPRPGKILCSGINYRSHQLENPDAVLPEEPFFFAKLPSTVIGHGQPIRCPQLSEQVDYEVEFSVIIGRTMTAVPDEAVMGHIFGYTILHDVSARDVQFRNNQVTLGKNFDTFCPLGPCAVTIDEIPNPNQIGLRTFLNGQKMQDGSTADWLFSLPKLLSFLSRRITLEPGDIVSTGTPAGVGVFRKPQVFLKPGDVVRLEADRIGVLQNEVN